MDVLIVESNRGLGWLWAEHVRKLGANVVLVQTQAQAEEKLREFDFDVLVVNLNLDPEAGDATALADYAGYRRPNVKVVCVTSSGFFSDGSIFEFMPNACAIIPKSSQPADLAAVVEYHAR